VHFPTDHSDNEVRNVVAGGDSDLPPAEMMQAIIERNYESVYRYAYRLCGSVALAEDVTQETFLKAVKAWGQLRASEAERGWLLAIARHEFYRRCRKEQSVRSGALETLGAVPESQPDGMPLEDRDWLQSALAALEPEQRQIVLMYHFEELSYAEIARELQIPLGTVMSRLSRARRHLRDTLERMAPEEAVVHAGITEAHHES
jgi:RNA polymerase sigma-70 factor, ECF subfamily